MKKTLPLLFALLFCSTGFAAWKKNIKSGFKKSQKDNKYLFVDFTGSSWCGYCVKLDEEVLKKREFKKFAKKNLVLVKLDYPSPRGGSKKLQKLAQEYKITGFPTVIIFSPDGKEIKRTGYRPGGAAQYVKHLEEIIATHKKENEK